MTNTISDERLIRRCLAGDQQAWDLLVDRYVRLVESVPRRHGFAAADVEDVAQGVFLSLYRNLVQLRESARLSSWLITTAYRETWRIGRRRKLELPDVVDTDSGAAPPIDEADRLEREHLVRLGLNRLGGACKQLLEAVFLGPVDSYEQIATQLGIPIGSIGPTRARCLRKLEPILRKLGLGTDL